MGKSFSGGIWMKWTDRSFEKKESGYLIRAGSKAGRHWAFLFLKDTDEVWTLRFDFGPHAVHRAVSQMKISALADGDWHHLGFSVEVDESGKHHLVTFWLDGEALDTMLVSREEEGDALAPESWGMMVGETTAPVSLDDAFATSGVYRFTPKSK
jgi:hypothetical protein